MGRRPIARIITVSILLSSIKRQTSATQDNTTPLFQYYLVLLKEFAHLGEQEIKTSFNTT